MQKVNFASPDSGRGRQGGCWTLQPLNRVGGGVGNEWHGGGVGGFIRGPQHPTHARLSGSAEHSTVTVGGAKHSMITGPVTGMTPGASAHAAAGNGNDATKCLCLQHVKMQQQCWQQWRQQCCQQPLPKTRRCLHAAVPVLLLSGGSPGLTKAHPVCLSSWLSGLVRCHVGCVTDRPM